MFDGLAVGGGGLGAGVVRGQGFDLGGGLGGFSRPNSAPVTARAVIE